MKREAFFRVVKKLRGAAERKPRRTVHDDGQGKLEHPSNWPAEKIVEWLAAKLTSARDWLKKGVPPEKWGAL